LVVVPHAANAAREPIAIIVTEYFIGRSPCFYAAVWKREGRASVAIHPHNTAGWRWIRRRRREIEAPIGASASEEAKAITACMQKVFQSSAMLEIAERYGV
jgi:hypothetical protein